MSLSTPERIEKLMALTEREFARQVAALGPAALEDGGCYARFALAAGSVSVRFTAREPVVLGGVVRMPRALVTLTFEGVSASERAAFLRRFDIAFQRGGG